MVAFAGAMEIPVRTAGTTLSIRVPGVTAPETAVIVVEPTPAPVATPLALMVATLVADELQVTVDVMSCIEPSE
jgi:hypothetical protein